MSDNDTESTLFCLFTRNWKEMHYRERPVNKAFENEFMPLFKVVPPSVGSFIQLEAKYLIDEVGYAEGKIILCCTQEF